MVGYALVSHVLQRVSTGQYEDSRETQKVKGADLVAALPSPVWQKWNRTSRRVFVKAYLPDMTTS